MASISKLQRRRILIIFPPALMDPQVDTAVRTSPVSKSTATGSFLFCLDCVDPQLILEHRCCAVLCTLFSNCFAFLSAATTGGLILKYVPFLTPTKLLMNLHRGTVPALDILQISHKNFELEKIDFTK